MRKLTLLILSFLLSVNLFGQNVLPFKKKNQKWCFVDTALNPINKKTYKEEIVPLRIHYFMIKKRDKYALANNLGKRVTRFIYDRISYSGNSFVADKPVVAFSAYIGKKEVFLNKDGDELKNARSLAGCGGSHAYPYFFHPYHKGNKIGFVFYGDINGDSIPALFDDFIDCQGHNAFVLQDGYWGVIDGKGKYVINPIYQAIRVKMDEENFIGAFVKIEDKWGYLNSRYKVIIPPKYKEMSDFKLGYSHVVTPENQSGLITASGKELFEK